MRSVPTKLGEVPRSRLQEEASSDSSDNGTRYETPYNRDTSESLSDVYRKHDLYFFTFFMAAIRVHAVFKVAL